MAPFHRADYFSETYTQARDAFCLAAQQAGAELGRSELAAIGPNGEQLTIERAYLGPINPARTVVISSGLHGVEGFFGSAVQTEILTTHSSMNQAADTGLLLLHALNPYGFAHLRRANENNVDLNRNFLPPGEAHRGAPQKYAHMNTFFNPPRPHRLPDTCYLTTALILARHKLRDIKEALAQGQYEFPKGLFFGGREPQETQKILKEGLGNWTKNAPIVQHLDLHTGLGPKGTYKLFLPANATDQGRIFWEQVAGAPQVIRKRHKSGYPIRGGLTNWCSQLLNPATYYGAVAEFGTHPNLAVFKALRAENRAHFFNQPGDRGFRAAKAEIKEAFAPADRNWRTKVIDKAHKLISKVLVSTA